MRVLIRTIPLLLLNLTEQKVFVVLNHLQVVRIKITEIEVFVERYADFLNLEKDAERTLPIS